MILLLQVRLLWLEHRYQLLVMFRLDRPVGPSEISDILEIDRHTAGKYMKSAVDLGFVTRPRYHEGYTLSISGRQLLLGVDNPVDNVGKIGANDQALVRFPPVLPTATTLIDSDTNKLGEEEVADPEWRENPQFEANIQALKEAGIGEPSRTMLAELGHVTPEYIQAHAAIAKDQKKGIGMLVHRIRSADPMPENGGHQEGCGCETCRHRYAGGEFSDHIHH